MRTVKVIFKDSRYNYVTAINGSDQSIRDYFVGQTLNMSEYRDDGYVEDLQVCIDVEFLKDKPDKGLRLEIYKDQPHHSCSNGGISSRCNTVTLVGDNIPKVFEVSEDAPAVKLVKRTIFGKEYLHIEPVEPVGKGKTGWMAGGSFVYSCDSRFRNLSPYPLSLHDRQE